jgi:pyruvate dehydrogenase E2 component (dihydrolipoamide acetyltransferase)
MLSMSMSEGAIAEWFVEDGGAVEEGQPLYSVENEKSVVDVEAPVSGTVHHLAAVGAVLPVGADVGTITGKDEGS